MNNLDLYNLGREVPKEAKREIKAGNIKGFTDINPMWRIKKLTEMFGACGIGWYYEITEKWQEVSEFVKEVSTFVQINLYVKVEGEWSKPIVGVGGNKFVSQYSTGAKMSDECYKMALTDALSVACKALGIGADVYWDSDRETKYSNFDLNESKKSTTKAKEPTKEPTAREKLILLAKEKGINMTDLAKEFSLDGKTTEDRFAEVVEEIKGR